MLQKILDYLDLSLHIGVENLRPKWKRIRGNKREKIRDNSVEQCCGSAFVSMRIRFRILVRLLSEKKWIFTWKMYLNQKHGTYEGKPFWKGRKPDLLINFGQFPCSWIQIRIPNTDPDPGQPKKCGSRRIRIHNTFFKIYFLTDFFIFVLFFVLYRYSTLLHLPPLRFHCADGCWDRTQDRCN